MDQDMNEVIADKKTATFTEGSIVKQLFTMTWPMIFGMLGLVVFNLVDTYFIGRLGVDQLAAMGFTFPVVTVLNAFALGLGIGAGSLISRAIGNGDNHLAARLTTDSLMLALVLAFIISLTGYLTVQPLFRLLGASDQVMPYIKDYMHIWYFGIVFVVVPMAGNNAIRATGDAKTPAVLMIFAGLCNALFDYLLIFGIGIFPEMGMAGAALATVLGRFLSFTATLYVLYKRENLLTLEKQKKRFLFLNWKNLLKIGIPAAMTKMMQPLTLAILTAFLSVFGGHVVAGFGVAGRLETFLTMAIQSFVAALGPFSGQNFGARKMRRLLKSRRVAIYFSLFYGLFLTLILWLFAGPLVSIFTDDPRAVQEATLYLRTVSLAYIFYGFLHGSSSIFNVTGKPRFSAFLMFVQMAAVCLPLAYLLRDPLGSQGVYLALAFSWLVMGLVSMAFNGRHLKALAKKYPEKKSS